MARWTFPACRRKMRAGACNAITLRSSFAPVRVALSDGGGYDLTSHTSFGKVSSELDVTASGTLGGDSLNGRIGGGGCPLQLTNSNGNIEILKATSRH